MQRRDNRSGDNSAAALYFGPFPSGSVPACGIRLNLIVNAPDCLPARVGDRIIANVVELMRIGLLEKTLASLSVAVVFAATSGCVQRKMLVRSNPPGAVVFVDNQEIGTTPCATDFIYYGTRDITLKKEGYETLTVKQPIPTPWYEYVPIDFVTENLVPGQILDKRVLEYNLVPTRPVATGDLVNRAENLRRSSHSAQVTPGMIGTVSGTISGPVITQPPTAPLFPGQPQPPLGGSLPNIETLPPPAYIPPPAYLPPPQTAPSVVPGQSPALLPPPQTVPAPLGGQAPLGGLPPLQFQPQPPLQVQPPPGGQPLGPQPLGTPPPQFVPGTP